ncbi:MAG: cyanophycinase [Deltaproteobacteria bacterium]|nr:cyanophycinase [Deltaproteobacteria bacterium]
MRRRLVLFGGGLKPPRALSQFVDWAGGPRNARILAISWASEEPYASQDSFNDELREYGVLQVEASYCAPSSEAEKDAFVAQLANATGVFFSGGDQNVILRVLQDQAITKRLRQCYDAGVVFAGTSAGMAILSPLCITGDVDPTRLGAGAVTTSEGLGLLADTIVDQHFLKRQRQNRLFGLALEHPDKLCIGVDEDAALAVVDNRYAEAHGKANQVLMIRSQGGPGFLGVTLLGDGQRFDLKSRKHVSGSLSSSSAFESEGPALLDAERVPVA